MLIIGHRGSPTQEVENTLPSVIRGLQSGADGIEVDIQLTQDGKIVCFHDTTGKRLAGVAQKIADSSWSALKLWTLTNAHGHQAKVTLLEDVLEQLPAEKLIEIEIKDSKAIVAPLLALLQGTGHQFKIISFQDDILAEVHRLDPSIYCNQLFHFGYYFAQNKQRMPLTFIEKKLRSSKAQCLGFHGNFHWSYHLKFLAKNFEVDLSVWTVNSLISADFFQRLGCVSLTSDHPLLLKQWHDSNWLAG